MFAFVVLLVVIGACFYFYQKITALEQEIRAEQARAKVAAAQPQVPPTPQVKEPVVEKVKPAEPAAEPVAPVKAKPAAKTKAATKGKKPAEDKNLKDAVAAAVAKAPGMKQPELYKIFADTHRKQLQRAVKDLAESGKIKRKKQGNTFLLYPS